MGESEGINSTAVCKLKIRSIHDTMDLLSGKWKFHIIGTLMQVEELRFMQLLREIDGIAPKMLSKELKDLEMNQLILRIEAPGQSNAVSYQLSDLGKSLTPIVDEMAKWGHEYRTVIVQN